MLVEATLDFPEEEIDILRDTDAAQRLSAFRADLASLLARARRPECGAVALFLGTTRDRHDGREVVADDVPEAGAQQQHRRQDVEEVVAVLPGPG